MCCVSRALVSSSLKYCCSCQKHLGSVRDLNNVLAPIAKLVRRKPRPVPLGDTTDPGSSENLSEFRVLVAYLIGLAREANAAREDDDAKKRLFNIHIQNLLELDKMRREASSTGDALRWTFAPARQSPAAAVPVLFDVRVVSVPAAALPPSPRPSIRPFPLFSLTPAPMFFCSFYSLGPWRSLLWWLLRSRRGDRARLAVVLQLPPGTAGEPQCVLRIRRKRRCPSSRPSCT